MNVNFGIIEPLGYRVKGKANKNLAIAKRALAALDALLETDEIERQSRRCELLSMPWAATYAAG